MKHGYGHSPNIIFFVWMINVFPHGIYRCREGVTNVRGRSRGAESLLLQRAFMGAEAEVQKYP